MARKDKRRTPKTRFDIDLKAGKPDLAAVFKEINRMIDSAARSRRKRKSELTRTGEIKGLGSKRVKAAYGFSIKLDRPERRSPRVRLLEKSDRIVIISQTAGAGKEKIGIKVKDRIVEVGTGDSGKKYHQKIRLPSAVKKRPLRSTYRNGVLKITLAKAKE